MGTLGAGDYMEKKKQITENIQESKAYIRERFRVPENFDLVFREFQVQFSDGFLIFCDGILLYRNPR